MMWWRAVALAVLCAGAAAPAAGDGFAAWLALGVAAAVLGVNVARARRGDA